MGRDGALLRASELQAVTRPLHEATNLPGALYTANDVFALEQDELFARMWLCVGRQEEIAEAGDYLTLRVAGENVLLVRDEAGAPRAFHNICRHRGACLIGVEAGSGAKAFRCGYHAWTYGLRGELLAAPLMEERAGFRRADHGLVSVRLETWGGFLFLNLDPEAPPLAAAMGDFPDLSRYRLPELGRAHRTVYEVDANWKVICENYSECYHCALVHPQLNRISDYRSGGHSEAGASYNGGPMVLNEGYSTMSMSGRSNLPPIEGLTEQDRRTIQYYNLYPNLLLGLAPDYVLVHIAWPLASGLTRVVCDWLFTPQAMQSEGFDPSDIVEFWDLTNRQDWKLCETVQAAAGSRAARPGPYHPSEACVHAFDNWFVETLGARLAALAG